MTRIKSISFKIATEQEIIRNSKVNLNELVETESISSIVSHNKLGAAKVNEICGTCGAKGGICNGHEGSYQLALPVINPGSRHIFKTFAKRVCFDCCSYNDSAICHKCKKAKPLVNFITPYTISIKSRIVPLTQVYEVFSKIPPEDYANFTKYNVSLDKFFIKTLIIPAVTIRPQIVFQKRLFSDDLTKKLETIVQVSQRLYQMKKINFVKNGFDDMHNLLQYHIFTYFDNKVSRVPVATHKNGKALKSILERIESKDGYFRANLAGKRTDFAIRSVITSDSNLELNEVGISESIAKNITIPVIVTSKNLETVKKWITNEDYVTAVYYEHPTENNFNIKLRITPETKGFILQNIVEGSKVHRMLMTGDYLVFNRQPTLHKYSMMAHKLVVYKDTQYEGKTIRVNPSCLAPYAGDFDGDEANIYPSKSPSAEADMILLMDLKNNIIDTKRSNPIVGITKELLTAGYYLSCTNELYDKKVVIDLFKEDFNLEEAKEKYTGKEIISMCLPNYFSYSDSKKDSPVIKNGQFISGLVTKRNFSKDSNLMKELASCCGSEFWNVLVKLLKVFRNFYRHIGYTLTLENYLCLSDYFKEPEKEQLKKRLKLVESSPSKVQQEVNKFQLETINELTQSIQKLDPIKKIKNPALAMTESNSSGNVMGLSQMLTMGGIKTIRNTLPSLYFKDLYPACEMKYNMSEVYKHGVILNGYLKGTNSEEYYNDAIYARDSNLDNQLNISTLGYFNRRMVAGLADLVLTNEGFVQDGSGDIIQWKFGGNNLDLVNYRPGIKNPQLIKLIKKISTYNLEGQKVITLKNLKNYTKSDLIYQIIYPNLEPSIKLNLKQLSILENNVELARGMAIGLITAHAITEPATQITLDSKHNLSGEKSRFTRLLDLTERILTKPKLVVHSPTLEPLKKLSAELSYKTLDDIVDISLSAEGTLLIKGEISKIKPYLLKKILLKSKKFRMTSSHSVASGSHLIFTPKSELTKEEVYKLRADLEKIETSEIRVQVSKIKKGASGYSLLLTGQKGSMDLYNYLPKLRTEFNNVEVLDPIYYEKKYGLEAGRKVLYNEFLKFRDDGINIDNRYFSLFCDLVSNKKKLLALGRKGVMGNKPPLARVAYEAAKENIYNLAYSQTKDYLLSPYSAIITGKPIKIGANYFELNL